MGHHDADKVEPVMQVPEPLLRKVRRLNTWLKGIDNPAMTPVQQEPVEDPKEPETAATVEKPTNTIHKNSNVTASSSSWVFTPSKDKPHTLKPGNKNFHESWSNIERYLQHRQQEPFIRRKRCRCVTRKCKFVTSVGFMAAVVLAAIVLVVYYVVFAKKGYMMSMVQEVQPSLANELEDHLVEDGDFSTSLYDIGNVLKATSTFPEFLVKDRSVLVLSTESQPSTISVSSSTGPGWTTTDLAPAGTDPPLNPDLLNLLLLPGPLQRFSEGPSSHR